MGCSNSKQVEITPAVSDTVKPARGDLYIAWSSPPCRSVLMLCAQMGIKLNLKEVNAFKGETRTPEFLAINPFHTVPTYVDGDFKLWESRAIMAYLVTAFGGANNPLYPSDPKKRARVDNVLNVDFGMFHKKVTEWLGPQLFPPKEEVDIEEKQKSVKESFKVLNDHYLEHGTYVAGDEMTIADLAVLSTVTLCEVVDLDLSEFGNIVRWVSKMKRLSYYEECNKGLNQIKEMAKAKKSG